MARPITFLNIYHEILKGQVPPTPEEAQGIVDLFGKIHDAVIERAQELYSKMENDDKPPEIVDVEYDDYGTNPMGGSYYWHDSDEEDDDKSWISQDFRLPIARHLTGVLDEHINMGLWGELQPGEDPKDLMTRRKYILGSIQQSIFNRMNSNLKGDRCDLEVAWFSVGMVLLNLVSGPKPLPYKDPLTNWILLIIGESSKMLLRGLQSIRLIHSYLQFQHVPQNKVWDDEESDFGKISEMLHEPSPFESVFHDSTCQPFGRPGMFSRHPYMDVLGSTYTSSNANGYATGREIQFFRIMNSLPVDLLSNPDESVLTSIMDVLLDYRIFSQWMWGGEGTYKTSETYAGFLELIDKCLAEEGNINVREYTREVIRCLLICVNHLREEIADQTKFFKTLIGFENPVTGQLTDGSRRFEGLAYLALQWKNHVEKQKEQQQKQ